MTPRLMTSVSREHSGNPASVRALALPARPGRFKPWTLPGTAITAYTPSKRYEG